MCASRSHTAIIRPLNALPSRPRTTRPIQQQHAVHHKSLARRLRPTARQAQLLHPHCRASHRLARTWPHLQLHDYLRLPADSAEIKRGEEMDSYSCCALCLVVCSPPYSVAPQFAAPPTTTRSDPPIVAVFALTATDLHGLAAGIAFALLRTSERFARVT